MRWARSTHCCSRRLVLTTAGTGRANASHVITSWKYFEVADHKASAEEEQGVLEQGTHGDERLRKCN